MTDKLDLVEETNSYAMYFSQKKKGDRRNVKCYTYRAFSPNQDPDLRSTNGSVLIVYELY